MNYYCRNIEEKDYSLCAQQIMKTFHEPPWNEIWTYEMTLQRIEEIMSSKVSRGYIVYDENAHIIGTMLGRVMTYLNSQEYWIDDFSIDPDYQRQHLGKSLLSFMAQELKKEGIQDILLVTRKDYPCVSFYTKNGFKEIEDLIVMVKNTGE